MALFSGLLWIAGLSLTHADDGNLPRVAIDQGYYRLLVDGAPYLILGGQAHNSTTSDPERLDTFFKSLQSLGGNTAEVPLYWEQIEPSPGQYDFTLIDRVLKGARAAQARVVLLWFGTWKNGESHYTPEWVKRDKKTYTRVLDAWGKETDIVSPLCDAAQAADARAFQAVMRYLNEMDAAQHTVILMQVENEPGLLGADRDYSAGATEQFRGAVPEALAAYLDAHAETLSESMKAVWRRGARGTWETVFGPLAEEAFSAWHVARYVNAVAKTGKEAYALPMYANAWLVEPGGERAGKWPSGGPTEHVLDIWKAAAPALDLIAPDIYFPKYRHYARQYARADNPLFVPEVNANPFFSAYPFQTFVEFTGLGFSIFGMDDAATDKKYDDFKVSYGVLRPLLPLIAQLQHTSKMQCFIQGISEGEDWAHTLEVAPGVAAVIQYTSEFDPTKARGRGMIIALTPGEYLVAGSSFGVTFRALEGPPRDIQILSIEEGGHDGTGDWIAKRRLNGDERSVQLPIEGGVLRAKILLP